MKIKYKAMQCQLFPVQLFICGMCKAENKMRHYLKYEIPLLLLILVLKFKEFVCLLYTGFQLHYKDRYH